MIHNKTAKIFQSVIIILISMQVLWWPLYTYASHGAVVDGNDDNDSDVSSFDDTQPVTDEYNPDDYAPSQSSSTQGTGVNIPADEDLGGNNLKDAAKASMDEINNLSSASKLLNNDKVVLSAVDRHKLEQMEIANSLVPNLEYSLSELATLSGKSTDDLATLQNSDPEAFEKLVSNNTPKVKTNDYIKQRLMGNPGKLASFLGIEEGEAIDRLSSEKDFVASEIDQALATTIDSRVLKMISYLITPKDQGGAGHTKIKVERITRGYDTDRKKNEKEDLALKAEKSSNDSSSGDKTIESVRADNTTIDQLYDPNDQTAVAMVNNASAIVDIVDAAGDTTASALIGDSAESANTVSAHFTGQAVDISEVDNIKCTLIEKKHVGSDKKTPQTPQPIKIAWQTTDGYNADTSNANSSYNQMFLNAGRSALANLFSDLGLSSKNLSNSQLASFSDMVDVLSSAMVKDELGLPVSNTSSYNLSSLLKTTGGASIADSLNLSRDAFSDDNINSVEALSEAVGRSYVESNLGLPYGALKGQSANDIFANITLARIGQEIGLSSGVLSIDTLKGRDITVLIGADVLERAYAFAHNSFLDKADLTAVASAVGKSKLDSFFSDPASVDEKLSLPSGMTQKLKTGAIAVDKYLQQVATVRLSRSVFQYPNLPGGSMTNQITAIVNGVGYSNLRDEMLNLQEGTIDTLFSDQSLDQIKGKLVDSGKYTLASLLEKSDKGRTRLIGWFSSPNANFSVTYTNDSNESVSSCLPVSNYTSKLGLSAEDFYLLFGQDSTGRGIFKKVGKKLLSISLQKNNQEQKISMQADAALPEFAIPTREDAFYKDKASKIFGQKGNIDKLRSSLETVNNDNPGKDALLKSFDDFSSSLAGDGKDGNGLDIMRYAQNILAKFYALSANMTDSTEYLKKAGKPQDDQKVANNVIYKTESIAKLAYEAFNNEDDDPSFRFEDLKLNAINPDLTTATGYSSISSSQLALLLSDRIDYQSYLKAVGSSKISYQLDLPANALKDLSDSIDSGAKDSKDLSSSSLRSLGLSSLLDKISLGQTSLSITAGSDLNQNITIGKLVSILSSKLGVSDSKAKSLTLQSFGLEKYNLDKLINGDFGEWAGARTVAEQNDMKNSLPKGTTEKYVRGQSLGSYDESILGEKSVSDVSDKLGVSESSLKTFLASKEGKTDAKYNKIYYKSYNPMSTQTQAAQASTTTGDNKSLQSGYTYYDNTGAHMFASYYQAEQYRVANSSSEIAPVDEIASRLMAGINQSASAGDSDANKLKAKLIDSKTLAKAMNDFSSNGQSNSLVDKDTYQTLEQFLYNKLGIERGTTASLFSRDEVNGSVGSVDYLKTLAQKHLSKNVLSETNKNLETSITPGEINSYDLMNILNGNSQKSLVKVGSSALEKEMGLKSGTMLAIIQSTDTNVKNQKMEEAALDLIATKLGVSNVDLNGDILSNLGKGKVESILNVAANSFLGGNFTELLKNLSPMEFVKALHLPVDKESSKLLLDILTATGTDKAEAYAADDVYQQLDILKVFMQNKGLDLLGDAVKIKISDLNSRLGKIASQVGSIPELFQKDPAKALTALKAKFSELNLPLDGDSLLTGYIDDFQAKLSSAEEQIGLDNGSLAKLMSGQIDANTLLQIAGRKLLSIGASGQSAGDALMQKLDLNAGTAINAGVLNNLINSIFTQGTPNFGRNSMNLGSTLLDLFSFNFDQKAGFSEGTIKNIVADPGSTWNILLSQGMRNIDAMISSDPNSTAFKDVLGAMSSQALSSACDVSAKDGIKEGSVSKCLNTTSSTNVSAAQKETAMNHVAESAKNFLASNSEVTKEIKMPVANGGILKQKVGGIVADAKDLQNIFKGDFRSLEIISLINEVSSIIGDKDGILAVPENFLLNYGDIVSSVLGIIQGNPNADDVLAQRAKDFVVSKANGSNDAVGYFASTAATALFTPGGVDQLNIQFPLTAASRYLFPTEPEKGSADHLGWELLQSRISYVQGTARANLTDLLAQELQYKIMDCNIFKTDKFIPAGFAKAMMAGNAFDKATVFTGYMKQWIQNIQDKPTEWAGQFLPEEWQGIYSYFTGNGPKDLTGLVQKFGPQLMDKLDKFITAKVPNVLGVNLGAGISSSLMAFIQTGNLEASVKTLYNQADVIINSFKDQFTIDGTVNMVGGWVDGELGLPAGTVVSIYNNWSEIASAQFEFAGLALSGPIAFAASLLFSKIKAFVIGQMMNMANEILSPIESALGLVPGSLLSLIMAGFSPLGIAVFILTNLFGTYKVELTCTADGYYPAIEAPLDPAKWDVPGLGTFDGLNQKERQAYSIKAARYEANRLIKDALALPTISKDKNSTPVQILTGRKEDADDNREAVKNTICTKVGSSGLTPNTSICAGWNSRSGVKGDPSTVAWTHLAF